jgi:hypothetical protein
MILQIAPHEVVVEILRRGLLEREDLAALWIYARHDVLDCAVFARRVHSLEDEQQRPAILGVENVLLLREPFGSALKKLARLAFIQLEAARVAGGHSPMSLPNSLGGKAASRHSSPNSGFGAMKY